MDTTTTTPTVDRDTQQRNSVKRWERIRFHRSP